MARNDFTDYQAQGPRPRYRRGRHPLVSLGIWAVVASVFFAGLYFGLKWLKKHDPGLRGQTGGLTEKPMVRLFFLDLRQRYLDNEAAAKQRYDGKVVDIENKGWEGFSRIEKQEGQTALVCFDIDKRSGGASESPTVICLIPTQNEKQFANLGKHWIIRGRVSEFNTDSAIVFMQDCEVVP